MRIRGIDVSKWQGNIDWQKVAKDDVHFAIIRVGNRGLTSGSISTDPYFEKNIKGALAVGLKVGVYFYSCSINTKEAEEEARFVLSKIKDYDIQMPVVFDFEGFGDKGNRNYGMTKAQITNNCIAFQKLIKASGYTCMLYASQSYMPKKFDLDKLTDMLWVARYPSSEKPISDEKYFPNVSGYKDRIAMWQYASCGTVAGINGRVDLNYMYIDVSKKTVVVEAPKEEPKKWEGSGMIEINAYSNSKDGSKSLSANFKVKEFVCKDGSDVIFIAPALVELLQKIRSHFGKAVTINSAYRTASYNKKIGGATYSQHMYGMAADIKVSGVKPKEVAAYVETLMPNSGGIGIYSNFTHVDVREAKSRWNG